MDSLRATFNSVRQAEQAREALVNLGVPRTHLHLHPLAANVSGDATPHPLPPGEFGTGQLPDLLEPNSAPSRAYSPLQSADPTLGGAPQGSVYPSADQDPNLGQPDYNRHELDAGLYQLEVDLEGTETGREGVLSTLEGAGGRISR